MAVGVLGVAFSWGLAAAQWHRARTSSAGISVSSWVLFLATNTAWFVYALGMSNPYLLANTVGSATLNAALLWRIDRHRWRSYGLVAGYGGVCSAVAVGAGWPALAVACFATAFAVRWPQLARAVTAEDLTGVSLTSWNLALVNNTLWLLVGLQRHDGWFAAANAALAASTVVLIAVVAVRRRSTT